MKILITGGTGFLGSALIHRLLPHHQITVFSRDSKTVDSRFGNHVEAVTDMDDLLACPAFDAVVNLAGAPIFDKRWTDSRKRLIRESRVDLTDRLVAVMEKMDKQPKVLVSGSAIGVYGNQGDTVLTESSSTTADFSQQLCTDWETSALQAERFGSRVCLVRTGLVLGAGGGMLQRMLLPFKLCLGGRIGNGQQWMSWIHVDDWVSIVETLLTDDTLQGAYNATAPNPVRNSEFTAQLAASLGRIAILPAPANLLKWGLGEMSELILGSQRVIPERLMQQGFKFKHEQLQNALADILKSDRKNS